MAIDRTACTTSYPGKSSHPLPLPSEQASYGLPEATAYLNKRLAKYQLELSKPDASQLLTAIPQGTSEMGTVPIHVLEETINAIINTGPEPFAYHGILVHPHFIESETHESEPPLSRDNSPDQHLYRQYINEIKKIPLLTLQEEINLAQSLRHPNTSARIRTYAFEEFVSRNLRLVVKLAKMYERRTSIPIMDLIQEGNQGLIRAVEHYKPELGYRFSTYATWWIRQSITRCMSDQKGIIRIPDYLNHYITKIRTFQKEYTQERGEPPSLKEISNILHIPIPTIKTALSLKDPISISKNVGDSDSDTTLEDFIPYKPHQPGHVAKQAAIHAVLNDFTTREKVILCLRYGLFNLISSEDFKEVCRDDKTLKDLPMLASSSHTEGLTLEEIGSLIPSNQQEGGITRERVRQIEQKALKKLKHPSQSKRLREFYFDEGDDHSLL